MNNFYCACSQSIFGHETAPYTDGLFSTATQYACFQCCIAPPSQRHYACLILLQHESDYPINASTLLLYVMQPKMHTQ